MEDIKSRLKETSENCLSSFEAWHGNKKDSTAREQLSTAVHELRKVASRLEIELAISERDENSQKPIPVPPHRDARRRGKDNQHDEAAGEQGVQRVERKTPRRRPQKQAGSTG